MSSRRVVPVQGRGASSPGRPTVGKALKPFASCFGRAADAHAAASALRVLMPSSVVRRVTTLKEKPGSAVYRLDGSIPGGGALLAKRTAHSTALHEHDVYTRVLPLLSLPALRCHGIVHEGSSADMAWIFVDFVDGVPFSTFDDRHREVAARLIARLHTEGAGCGDGATLPRRDAGHYLRHLRSARLTLLANLGNPRLRDEGRAIVREVIEKCDALEVRWHEIEAQCEALPETLVHGDLKPGNMLIRETARGQKLTLLDWETTGWGFPGPDLSWLHLPTYRRGVRDSWPGLDLCALRRTAAVGLVLRTVASIDWASCDLQLRWLDRPLAELVVYRDILAHILPRWGD